MLTFLEKIVDAILGWAQRASLRACILASVASTIVFVGIICLLIAFVEAPAEYIQSLIAFVLGGIWVLVNDLIWRGRSLR